MSRVQLSSHRHDRSDLDAHACVRSRAMASRLPVWQHHRRRAPRARLTLYLSIASARSRLDRSIDRSTRWPIFVRSVLFASLRVLLQSLNSLAMPVPAKLLGVWSRTLLQTARNNVVDFSTRVYWMQTSGGEFGDLRVPKELIDAELSPLGCCGAEDLEALCRQQACKLPK